MTSINQLGSAYWRLLSLPATLAHELTHMLLARPWADESAIIWEDDVVAHHVNWTDGVPRSAVAMASLGPTILGAVVGLIGLVQLAQAPPETVNETLMAGAIAGWWVIYATPSSDDMDLYSPTTDTADNDTNESTQ